MEGVGGEGEQWDAECIFCVLPNSLSYEASKICYTE